MWFPVKKKSKTLTSFPSLCSLVRFYSSGHLVLSHLGLAFVLMLRPFFPELVMSTDLLSFEHPSVLLFCFWPFYSINDDINCSIHICFVVTHIVMALYWHKGTIIQFKVYTHHVLYVEDQEIGQDIEIPIFPAAPTYAQGCRNKNAAWRATTP